MTIPEQFDDPSDITVPNFGALDDHTVPNYGVPDYSVLDDDPPPDHDSGSLRPQLFSSEDWFIQTRAPRPGPGPFLALGIVVGMAAALPAALWAVRSHGGPSAGPEAHAVAASPMTRPAAGPVSAAVPALEKAPSGPTPEFDALTDSTNAPVDAHLTSNEKLHKKRTGPAKHGSGRSGGARSLTAGEARETRSVGTSETATPGDSDTVERKSATSKPIGSRSLPGGATAMPVEDQAAAELSMSLK